LKQEEELQRLLLNGLNHRVKNILATIQAISSQTLRAARDLPSARVTFDRRICSLARAHDLLTIHPSRALSSNAWKDASPRSASNEGSCCARNG
jgi:two-component sensor histidine kinase